MRIEVRIEYDNSICAPQINAHSASARSENVDEYIGVRFIELIHSFLAVALFGVPVLLITILSLEVYIV